MALGSVGLLVVALGIVGASMALAEEGAEAELSERRGRGPGMRGVARITEQLELDEEQKGYLAQLKELRRSERAGRRGKQGSCMKDILATADGGSVDADAVHAAIDERFARSQVAAHARADLMIAFVSSLDEGQRATLQEEIENGRSRRQARMRGEGRDGRRGKARYQRGGGRGHRGPRGEAEELDE